MRVTRNYISTLQWFERQSWACWSAIPTKQVKDFVFIIATASGRGEESQEVPYKVLDARFYGFFLV